MQQTQKLAKFLSYVLGRRPDEFGLVPSTDGYYNIKEVIKALNEEQGWRHIRVAHLKEVALALSSSTIELQDKLIRSRDRTQLPEITPAGQMPKLLYIGIRRRAYPTVAERGMKAGDSPYLVLTPETEMAKRIGQRKDHQPVILTVQVAQSNIKGTQFQKFGECLYLADAISTGCFTGPPIPKDKPVQNKEKKAAEPSVVKTPGSYFPDLSQPDKPKRPRRKEVEWKKGRRLARRHKSRQRQS